MNFSVQDNVLTALVDLSPGLEREFEERCKKLVLEATAPPVIELSEVTYVSKEYTDILTHAADASAKRGFRLKVRLKAHLARLLSTTSYNLVGDVEEVR